MRRNKELETLSEDELKKKISEIKKDLIKIKGQSSVGTSQKNPYAIKNNKRTIARILTILNQKKLGIIPKKTKKTGEEKKNE